MIDWSFIFSMISAIVIAVTVIILIIQTWILYKEAGAALDASSAQSFAQMLETELKINEVFLRKPELRQYFYGGVHLEENSPVYADAESAAELFLDIMEHVLWQARFFPQFFAPQKTEKSEVVYKDTWNNYFHDMFISSPLLRKYLEKRQRWYSPLVIDIMKRANANINLSREN
jgi:hypothetical protein